MYSQVLSSLFHIALLSHPSRPVYCGQPYYGHVASSLHLLPTVGHLSWLWYHTEPLRAILTAIPDLHLDIHNTPYIHIKLQCTTKQRHIFDTDGDANIVTILTWKGMLVTFFNLLPSTEKWRLTSDSRVALPTHSVTLVACFELDLPSADTDLGMR